MSTQMMLPQSGPNYVTASTLQQSQCSVKKELHNVDWYGAYWAELQPVTVAMGNAQLAYKQNPYSSTCDAFCYARNNFQQTARR